MTGSSSDSPCGARIEARGLTRRFGGVTALDGLDLDIEAGETFGLLGANGAGKTTFIRLVTGLLVPTRGRLRVDGLSPAREPRAVQARVGYVAETPRLYDELTVQGSLELAGGLYGLAGGPLARAIDRASDHFGLAGMRRRRVAHLSKGFRQRLSLAQSFLHDPALLIVDEPTSGLDPLQRQEVHTVLDGLRGRRTVLLCTHDLEEARALTSRVAVLSSGRASAVGATPAVLGGEGALALFRGERATGTGP